MNKIEPKKRVKKPISERVNDPESKTGALIISIVFAALGGFGWLIGWLITELIKAVGQ